MCYAVRGDLMHKEQIILASASARRRDLMKLMGLEFTVIPSGADERMEPCPPERYVTALAERKALYVAKSNPNSIVIGADTVVVLDGDIIGKPKDRDDAYRILRSLSGRTHTVYSGISVVYGDCIQTECDMTKVTFAHISDEEIWGYIDSGDPMDKAGAYGVQGPFCVNITRIEGSFFTVVGLPVHMLYRMLAKRV